MIGLACNFNWGRLVTSRATRIHNGHERVWGLPVVAAYEYLPRLLDWAAARSRESPSKSGDVVSTGARAMDDAGTEPILGAERL